MSKYFKGDLNMKEIIPFNQLEIIAKSLSDFPVDFDDAWKWVGYASKQKGLDQLKANFEEGIDYTSINQKVKREIGATQKRQINLTADCFKSFCMMAGTEKGKDVRKYFITVEKQFLKAVQELKASKVVRKDFTDIIKESGINEAMHGFAYKNFTDLVYRQVLGMSAKQYREIHNLPVDANIRDHVSMEKKSVIMKLEKIAGSFVEAGEGYQRIKEILEKMNVAAIEAAGKKKIA